MSTQRFLILSSLVGMAQSCGLAIEGTIRRWGSDGSEWRHRPLSVTQRLGLGQMSDSPVGQSCLLVRRTLRPS